MKEKEITLCARSEDREIKYPRTCPIHIWADVICCAFTEIYYVANSLLGVLKYVVGLKKRHATAHGTLIKNE